MNGCHNWQQLRNKCGKPFEPTSSLIPLYFLEKSIIEKFWRLVDKYRTELESVYNPSIHLPDSLLAFVVDKKMHAVAHDQIDKILWEFNEETDTPERFVGLICCSDCTAFKVLKCQRKDWELESSQYIKNPWLNNATYQQNFYAYYYFDNTRVHIKVREWDTGVEVPDSKVSVVNKRWFVDYMVGYVNMLSKEFVTLGYQSTFEFFKIQNVFLPNLTSEFKDKNHPKHGIHSLVEKLLAISGQEVGGVPYSKITEDRGIKVSFTKEIYR
tara:strand:+ start:19805 stop:20611 length:807 start_codon:yes stop_codon:yes gene_type:complete